MTSKLLFIILFIQNVSSSISHQKNPGFGTPWLQDFSFFLCSIFVYEPIIINISMMADIMKTQILYCIKYDLRGHQRSHKVILEFHNHLFLRYIFVISSFKSLRMSTLWKCKFFIKWSMTSKIIQGHTRPLLC